MRQLEAEGLIRQGRNGRGIPERKMYLHDSRGKPIPNLWDDIPRLVAHGNERTGSPDQKPVALYEGMILASNNPGDLVLDLLCGCATTLMAAGKNNRRWVGIDRRKDVRRQVVCRMLGIRADEAEKQARSPMYGEWITTRLAELDNHYRTVPPARTDSGGAGAPEPERRSFPASR